MVFGLVAGSLGAVFTALGGGGWYAGAPDDMPDMFMCLFVFVYAMELFPHCYGLYRVLTAVL